MSEERRRLAYSVLLVHISAGLKQQNSHLTQVEVDEMLRLVGHIATKVPPNNAVPCRVVFFVKFLQRKDKKSNIFLDIVLLHGLHGTVHGILLHFIRHVCIFDHRLLV
uniref:Uncharacterized protein n=1 Tax=Oryzias sinensis TaxID=183150 RepID=A0A8C7X7K9_9TELE